MIVFWASAAVVFLVIEAATIGLASIWFALGALGALLVAVLGAKLWLQIGVFIAVTIATIVLTRPLIKKYINGKKQATNADRIIGNTYLVTERIDGLSGTGAISADGKIWTARSADGSLIEKGEIVEVTEIQGVKAIVIKTN